MKSQALTQSAASRWAVGICVFLFAWTTLQAQDAPPVIPTPDLESKPAHTVVRVTEECTVSMRIGEEEESIRLAGVSVPEAGEKGERERLRSFLENLLGAEAVFLQCPEVGAAPEKGARLAYLFRAPDGLFVNLEVVRQGYAGVLEEPSLEHLDVLRFYERRARSAEKGVWAPRSTTKQPEQAASAENEADSDLGKTIVYVTKSGKKYHRKGCQYLRKSCRPITLQEAVERGYEPCSRCKPPTLKEP
jgi:endonuclease YncB( thermonuclease family)